MRRIVICPACLGLCLALAVLAPWWLALPSVGGPMAVLWWLRRKDGKPMLHFCSVVLP